MIAYAFAAYSRLRGCLFTVVDLAAYVVVMHWCDA